MIKLTLRKIKDREAVQAWDQDEEEEPAKETDKRDTRVGPESQENWVLKGGRIIWVERSEACSNKSTQVRPTYFHNTSLPITEIITLLNAEAAIGWSWLSL